MIVILQIINCEEAACKMVIVGLNEMIYCLLVVLPDGIKSDQ